MSTDRELPDIQAGLRQLGETTTAADLVRQRGQTKKVTVISERRLKEWIEAILSQFRAGREDSFSDDEKQLMLTRTQEELAKRIKREQEAAAERDRLKAELDHAMQVVAEARTTGGVDSESALNDLKAQLETCQRVINELQDEKFQLQDELGEQVELIRATIAEKDRLREDQQKLRDTIKAQMLHSGDLVQGVLGLDEAHYGGRHSTEVPEGEDDAAFYRDFSVGAKVIATLGQDLDRLRELAREKAERGDQPAGLLAEDLALIADLKAGKLEATDVAAPVESLAEALRGARAEAMALDQAVAAATGGAPAASLPPAPEGDGAPAEVLADATALVRDLTVQLVQERRRIAALAQMAADADTARNDSEEEVERLRQAFNDTTARLGEKAAAARLALAESLSNRDADPAERAAAAIRVVDELAAAGPVAEAALAQIALVDGLVPSDEAAPMAVDRGDSAAVAERLRRAGTALEAYARELVDENAALRTAFEDTVARLREKADRARLALAESLLDREADPAERAQAAIRLLDQLTADSPVGQAAVEQLALVDRLLGRNGAAAHAAGVEAAESGQVADRLRDAGLALEAYAKELHAENSRLVADLGDQRQHQAQAAAKAAELAAEVERITGERDAQHHRLAEVEAKARESQQATGVFRAQSQQQADLLTTAKAEAERLRGELAAQTAATRRAEDDAVTARAAARTAAQAVVAAAQGDHDLVDATTDLALDLDGGDAVAVAAGLAPAVAALAGRKTELVARVTAAEVERNEIAARLATVEEQLRESAAEQAENAASAKEVITQLSQARDQRERELRDLREARARAESAAADQAARAAQAESTARALADALGQIAAAEPERPAASGDFEATVAQLPADGEEDIPMAAATAAALAESGRRLAESLVQRRRETGSVQARAAADTGRLQEELDQATARIAELTAKSEQQALAVRKEHAEREAVLRELTSQAAILAAKTQEAAAARSGLAAMEVDVETLREQVATAQARAAATDQDLAAVRDRLAKAERELGEARAAAEAGERSRTAVSESLRLLPAAPGDAAVAALNRAEAAAAAGDRAGASERIGEAVRLRLAALTTDLDRSRQQAESARAAVESLQAGSATLSAAITDRDQRIAALESTVVEDRRRGEEAATAAAAGAARVAALEAEAARLREDLDHAQDRIADFEGRSGFAAGTQEEELSGLRSALGEAKTMITGFAKERSELRAAVSASEARQRKLREEYEARLAERDRLIQERDRALDARGDQSADMAALRAQVTDLEARLSTSARRVAELETAAGGSAGLAGRSGDLAREMKRMQEERDRLRDDLRRTEGELVDARSQVEELTSTVEERRTELIATEQQATDRVQAAVRTADESRAEVRRLQEEIAGLRSRLRRTDKG